jgi:TPR repeat protein
MSEIGASLLFCYNHVQQDLPRAKHFLERASELGDSYAMRSLASMHLSNLTEDENAAELGSELLERCQSLGNAQCGAAPGKIQKKNSKGP